MDPRSTLQVAAAAFLASLTAAQFPLYLAYMQALRDASPADVVNHYPVPVQAPALMPPTKVSA
jgi:hypothetical protein